MTEKLTFLTCRPEEYMEAARRVVTLSLKVRGHMTAAWDAKLTGRTGEVAKYVRLARAASRKRTEARRALAAMRAAEVTV